MTPQKSLTNPDVVVGGGIPSPPQGKGLFVGGVCSFFKHSLTNRKCFPHSDSEIMTETHQEQKPPDSSVCFGDLRNPVSPDVQLVNRVFL